MNNKKNQHTLHLKMFLLQCSSLERRFDRAQQRFLGENLKFHRLWVDTTFNRVQIEKTRFFSCIIAVKMQEIISPLQYFKVFALILFKRRPNYSWGILRRQKRVNCHDFYSPKFFFKKSHFNCIVKQDEEAFAKSI